jgi:transcriptional regulator with XRE-family HTH domain
MLDPHAIYVRALGRRIAARRISLGLSQVDVAERLGMASPESLSRYERGEREPRCSTLARLAEALSTTPGALMEDPRPIAASEAPPIAAEAGSVVWSARHSPLAHDAARMVEDLERTSPETATLVVAAVRGVWATIARGPTRGK